MKRIFLRLLLLGLSGCVAYAADLAHAAEPAPGAPETAAASLARVPGIGDYWQRFLARFVDTTAADHVNRIRYAAVTPADRDSLDGSLAEMQSRKVSTLSRGAQKAFWINLYNAKIVALTLRHYPLKSVMDIRLPGGDSSKGMVFRAKLMQVEDSALSLDDIENRILRPGWRDCRIHFALNCASIGCPNLAPVALTEENIQSHMAKSARSFLGSPRGVAFEGNVLRLSSVFEWYREDFGRTDAVVLGILANYADPALKDRLRTYTGPIKYQYDWRLNEALR